MSSDDEAPAGAWPADARSQRGASERFAVGDDLDAVASGSAEVEPDIRRGRSGPGRRRGAARGSALLVVQRGPERGQPLPARRRLVTAGRHPDSDIFLDDVTVSRRHAQFVRIGAGYAVKDVGSLNGTYVNRQRIDEALLSGGDEVQIGKYRLVYLVGPAVPGATQ